MQKPAYSSDCDIIIVNYNSATLLAECISSIIPHDFRSIIVVDNGSKDNSLAQAEGLLPAEKLVIIRNKNNLGFASACNIGIRASSATYMLFLNPDCTLKSDAIKNLLDVFDSDPAIGMAGGFLCNADGSEQPGGRRVFPTPRRAFIRAFGLSRLGKFSPEFFPDFLLHKEPLPTQPVKVEAISGACMLVGRKAVDDVGLWDEGYFLHCEDLDWCMRFKQRGYHVMFVPNAIVFHVWGACGRSRPIFVEWHKHKGMMLFYQKFFRHQYPGALFILVAAGVWLRFSLVTVYYAAGHFKKILGLSSA